MTITTIKTPFRRELTVEKNSQDTYLQVTGDDFTNKHDVKTYLPKKQLAELIDALMGEDATVVTDLPETTREYGFVTANGYDRGENADPAELVRHAKALLAIAANITEHKAEQEAAKAAEEAKVKAKEAANTKRRDELASELSGYGARYEFATELSQKAIDRIIELEEAAKV